MKIKIIFWIFLCTNYSLRAYNVSFKQLEICTCISGDTILNLTKTADTTYIYTAKNKIMYVDSHGGVHYQPTNSSNSVVSLSVKDGCMMIKPSPRVELTFKGNSIRFIDKTWIASYGPNKNGIYRNDRRFGDLNYSNGTIKEFNNRIYINWDGLTIISDSLITDYTDPILGGVLIDGNNYGSARDLYVLGGTIYLATTNGIFKTTKFNTVDTVNFSPGTSSMFAGERLTINQYIKSIYAFSGSKLLVIDNTGKVNTIKQVHSPIYGFNSQEKILHTRDSIFFLNQNESVFSEIPFHTVFKVNDEFFGSSDSGIFKISLNGDHKQLSKEEFNARSFFQTDSNVYLGSVRGLYSFKNEFFSRDLQIAPSVNTENQNQNPLIVGILAFLVFVIISLIILLLINKNSGKKELPLLTDQVIIDYITRNLSTVSIASIMDEFNLSQKELYNLFPHASPGKIIKLKKKEKISELQKLNKSDEFISKSVGYSIRYLKQNITSE